MSDIRQYNTKRKQNDGGIRRRPEREKRKKRDEQRRHRVALAEKRKVIDHKSRVRSANAAKIMLVKWLYRYTFFVLREGRSRENEKATVQGINALDRSSSDGPRAKAHGIRRHIRDT